MTLYYKKRLEYEIVALFTENICYKVKFSENSDDIFYVVLLCK